MINCRSLDYIDPKDKYAQKSEKKYRIINPYKINRSMLILVLTKVSLKNSFSKKLTRLQVQNLLFLKTILKLSQLMRMRIKIYMRIKILCQFMLRSF